MTISKIKIPQFNAILESIRVKNDNIPGAYVISVEIDEKIDFKIILDERSNQLSFPKTIMNENNKEIIDYLLDKFKKLKSTDISFGSVQSEINYDPTKNIFVKDFFDFLKIEIRNELIEGIIK